jgi:hypothetical protein
MQGRGSGRGQRRGGSRRGAGGRWVVGRLLEAPRAAAGDGAWGCERSAGSVAASECRGRCGRAALEGRGGMGE